MEIYRQIKYLLMNRDALKYVIKLYQKTKNPCIIKLFNINFFFLFLKRLEKILCKMKAFIYRQDC